MRLHSNFTFIFLALVVFSAGCAGSGRVRYESPEDALDKGIEQFERGKYQRAAEYFQGVFDFGRMSEEASDAQLYLARSYYHDRQYILAASEYSRFIQVYRSDPRLEEASFERAMSYYQLSPSFELDQTETGNAVTHFQLFMNRFPESLLVQEAEEKRQELIEKMARKQYETAGLYERRELYRAAALQFESAFDRYPGTSWADDALVGAMRMYLEYAEQSIAGRREERLRQAVDHYQRLLQLFPDSPRLKEAELLYEQAVGRLENLTRNS